jgi:hypothetical protein
MRRAGALLVVVAANATSPRVQWAKSGVPAQIASQVEFAVLFLQVSDYHDRPIAGVVLSAKGTGSTSKPTDVAGKTQLVLQQRTQPGGDVFLILVRAPSKNLMFFSPWHGHATVPSSGGFIDVVLGVPGTAAALSNTRVVQSVAVAINEMNASKGPPDDVRQRNLQEVSKELGLGAAQVDRGIRAWAESATTPRQKQIAAEYLGLGARRPISVGKTESIAFKAPSAFVAGDATLPAGSYSVTPWSEDPSVLEIANAAGTNSVLVDTETTSSETAAKSTGVVFAKYGTMLVMKQIVLANQRTGYGIISRHAEKKAAKGGPAAKQIVGATAQ